MEGQLFTYVKVESPATPRTQPFRYISTAVTVTPVVEQGKDELNGGQTSMTMQKMPSASELMPPPPPPPPPRHVANGHTICTRRGSIRPPLEEPKRKPKPAQPIADPRVKINFCCKSKRVFSPHPIYCECGDCGMAIGPYIAYRRANEHVVCEKCFAGNKANIYISDSITIQKSEFTRAINNEAIDEPVKVCYVCEKKFHSVCEVHMDNIWPRFCCEDCLGKNNVGRKNPYRAHALPKTSLSDFIETRLNHFLLKNKVPNKVFVRVISSEEGKSQLGPNMIRKYQLSTKSYPYRNKLIFAFEEMEGADVAFFAFIVQEYYSDCPQPNRGRVYISYLDSVNLFQPSELRTKVYQTILLAYFAYVKRLGFQYVHIWACPPGPTTGGNYIFYNHPRDMKFPNHARLQTWYKKLLTLGEQQGIILSYSNLAAHAAHQLVSCAKDIAYFDGDHWPTFFESAIVDLEKKSSALEYRAPPKKMRRDGGKYKKRQTDEYPPSLRVDAVMHRAVTEMYGHGDMFFVAKLNELEKEIIDPDRLSPCAMLQRRSNQLNSRDVLLQLLTKYNYEFCSVRKAKYSTLGLVYKIMTTDWLYCNQCGCDVGTDWFVCLTCATYDLCKQCKDASPIDIHPHPLILHSLKPAAPTRPLDHRKIQEKDSCKISKSLTPNEEAWIVKAFAHAQVCVCEVKEPLCHFGRKLIRHMSTCTIAHTACQLCTKLFELAVIHFINCTDANCILAICRWWENDWAKRIIWKINLNEGVK